MKDGTGQMAEWLMAADCKSAALTCYGGSNPSLPTIIAQRKAHVAQSVEHVLGKDGVSSSNLLVGSICQGNPEVGFPRTPSAPIAFLGGSNSGVESQPSKLLVAGSNPVSRSTSRSLSRDDAKGCSSNWLERRSPKP
jgi:hypothetical protein